MKCVVRDPIQVRLTGAGGQGIISAGVILAEACLRDGRNVVQTQSYGPEARLGASKAEVIISSTSIAYPEVITPDILLCLSADAARKYIHQIHPETIIVLDSSAGEIESGGIVHRLPLIQTALQAGTKAATNVIALWAMNSIAGLVKPEILRTAILERLPARFRESNERAIRAAQQLLAASIAAPVATTPHTACA